MWPKQLKYTLLLITFIALFAWLDGCVLLADKAPAVQGLTRVKITKVVDGDTAYALMPDGSEEKLRFIGVNSPEINHPTKGLEPYGPEAEVFTRSQLEGKNIWLEFDAGERDQYGRMLAYLWLEIPEKFSDQEIRAKMFNARLLLEGYAVQVIFEPNVKYVQLFTVYEAEAKEAGKGLWDSPE
jgi:micrococcal nuclease